ncbi:DASS family sodium-coupled anion symporter [Muricauda sp. 334s03]|uniref:DASS family sodium-coupled anion symporter n=1 Tax=Flagellimonas yonaguniensis TaxID=3031325 RepID=A0ABT5Y3U2_9FLAO|nr:DASS family sodium-coupled anion symporter [[Muricauda] yonaguniensis]MDF0718112.1 DASS family sodium-coupled anion symporter [[Muricauda] yonaguniensis]
MSYKKFGFVLGPLLFALVHFHFAGDGLSEEGRDILAATLWIGVWWVFEVIPIAATALLPIILFPLLGSISLSDTTASYGHKYVFLYMGGFMLAIAMEKWGLHKRIALHIIRAIGTNMYTIVLGFMVATAFLSMWISNTATTVMVLPMAISIVKQLKDSPNTLKDENELFGKLMMLGIAYAASIGGIATLIGTPPNLVFAGFVQEAYGVDISFWQWMKFGVPVASVLLVLAWLYLTRLAYPLEEVRFPGGKKEINRLLVELGPMGKEEKMVLFVFVLTAFCWITRSFLLQNLIPGIDDTIIAIGSAILLFIIPANGKGRPLIQWDEALGIPWGIILLFGGGLAIAKGFQDTGLDLYLGGQMTFFDGFSLFGVLLLVVASINFLTEITSNLATTAMMLPVLAPLAVSLQVDPFILMVACTVAASCAFMLPVATPPNAVVFGAGYLRIPEMVRSGFFMNMVSIVLMTLAVYFLLPLVMDFPDGMDRIDVQLD